MSRMKRVLGAFRGPHDGRRAGCRKPFGLGGKHEDLGEARCDDGGPRQPVDGEAPVHGGVHLRRGARATRAGPMPRTSAASTVQTVLRRARRRRLYKEDVPEGPQCAQVITQLVDAGANIIFATSYGYQPELVAAAAKYPKVLFEQATGTTVAKTLARVLRGRRGRRLPRRDGSRRGRPGRGNNKIGFVAPYPIPECLREVDAFTMGAQLDGPEGDRAESSGPTPGSPRPPSAQPPRASSADGVSVLADGQDSPTTGQVAEGHGLKWIGYDSNQESFAPNSWLTATTYNWGPYYVQEVKAAMNGTWKSHFWYGSLADGFVHLAPFGKSVDGGHPQRRSSPRSNAIIKGTFDPFTGPIYGQNGKIVVPKGVTLTVMQKYSITWFVKGVIGNPKG